jgi:hypothetical protein
MLFLKAFSPHFKVVVYSWWWWLTPVILVTQEAEIRGLQFEANPGK